MPLLYDAFGVRRVAAEIRFWPDIGKFKKGILSELFAAVNDDEIFSEFELRSETGALLTGDDWTYELSTTGLFMRCTNFATADGLRSRMRRLLNDTRECIAPGRIGFFTEEIRVFGDVPEGGNRDVEKAISKRLIKRGTDLTDLPGFEGAGLKLSGMTEDYHWHAEVEPADYERLMLTGRLRFWPGEEPPMPGPDLDVIDGQIDQTYEFVKEHLRSFSSKYIK